MRIPVYPDDLLRNRGFKSLAKQLRKLLRGPSRIPLAFAEDILAKGFGYQSYHDLEQTAKTCSPAELTVTQKIAKRAIFSGMKSALQTGEVIVDEHELIRLVGSFALASLVAFKRSREIPSPGKQGLTADHVQALGRAVRSSGNLRDKALFACMQAGVRSMEYRSAIWIGQFGACLLNKSQRSNGYTHEYSPLPKSCQGAIAKYVKASRLSEGDLLFPSAKDPKLPMSAPTLTKLLFTWARKANIKAGPLTAHGIRKNTDTYESRMHRIGASMVHAPSNITLSYVGPFTSGLQSLSTE